MVSDNDADDDAGDDEINPGTDQTGQPIEARRLPSISNAPISARLASDGIDHDRAVVRIGSPFAPGTVVEISAIQNSESDGQNPESAPVELAEVLDAGAIRYTATGAVMASVVVVMFGAMATWWFPLGGTLVAALGCGLSAFGMFSGRRILATSLLLIHLSLFVACYGRALA